MALLSTVCARTNAGVLTRRVYAAGDVFVCAPQRTIPPTVFHLLPPLLAGLESMAALLTEAETQAGFLKTQYTGFVDFVRVPAPAIPRSVCFFLLLSFHSFLYLTLHLLLLLPPAPPFTLGTYRVATTLTSTSLSAPRALSLPHSCCGRWQWSGWGVSPPNNAAASLYVCLDTAAHARTHARTLRWYRFTTLEQL